MSSLKSKKIDLKVLENLRESIDRLDAILVYTLAERFVLTQKVGHLKASSSIPPSDPERELQQITRLEKLALEAGLDPTFAKDFLRFIISEVIKRHEKIQEQTNRKKYRRTI